MANIYMSKEIVVCQKLAYESDQGELAQPSALAAATRRTIAPTSSVWMKV